MMEEKSYIISWLATNYLVLVMQLLKKVMPHMHGFCIQGKLMTLVTRTYTFTVLVLWIDGYACDTSSGRAELHGITALSIMTQLFLNYHFSTSTMEAVCDNQVVITNCGAINDSWLASNSKHLMSAGERAITFMPML
jgi:hypothetical protein